MKKYDVFQFTAPNGVEVVGAVVDITARWLDYNGYFTKIYLCYSQNRLFTWKEVYNEEELIDSHYGRVVLDYVVLPEYDSQLENYYHELDKANDYASKEY